MEVDRDIVYSFKPHRDSICAVCILPGENSKILTAGEDLFIRVSDFLTGTLEREMHSGHTHRIR